MSLKHYPECKDSGSNGWNPKNFLISTLEGELIADVPQPAPRTKYVGLDRATLSFQNADQLWVLPLPRDIT